MLEFIVTLSIFLLIFVEIALTIFLCKKLLAFEVKIDEIHIKMFEKAKQILEINDEIKKAISKTNKIIRIISNKKLHQIRRIIMMTIDIIQAVMFFKSLDLSKGSKSINFKMLRNLAYAKVIQQVIKRFIDFAQNLCAI